MTSIQTILARAALGLIATAAGAVAVSLKPLYTVSARTFDRLAISLFVAGRLALYLLVFGVLHIAPRGDVPAIYFPEALQALGGLLPYRDIHTSYAPLHPYLDAAVLSIWRSPLAIILFALLVESVLLPLWLSIGRSSFPIHLPRRPPPPDPLPHPPLVPLPFAHLPLIPEHHLRTATLLYIASPLSLVFVTIDGQNNVILAVLLALALFFLVRSRPSASAPASPASDNPAHESSAHESSPHETSAPTAAASIASGAAAAAGAVLVKFLCLLYLPAFFLVVDRRIRWLLGVLATIALGYGAFLWMRLPILYPLTFEGGIKTSSNLPFLIESFLGVDLPGKLLDLLALAALAAVFALMARATRQASASIDQASAPSATRQAPLDHRMRVLIIGMAILTLVLVLLSKRSWPPYLIMTLFPLCLLLAEAPGRRPPVPQHYWPLNHRPRNSPRPQPLTRPAPHLLPVLLFGLFSTDALVAQSYWTAFLANQPALILHQTLLRADPSTLLFLTLQLIMIAGYLWLLQMAIRRLLSLSRPRTLPSVR